MLRGFFVGWPNPPSPEMHLRILNASDKIVLALDEDVDRVVGFINAITDNVLCCYIPLLEVLPEYQKHGIGRELVERLLKDIGELYMIDLVCNEDKVAFYEHLGMRAATAMTIRNFDAQCGR